MTSLKSSLKDLKPYQLSKKDLLDISLYHLNRKIRFIYIILGLTFIFMALNEAKAEGSLAFYLLGYSVFWGGAVFFIKLLLKNKAKARIDKLANIEENIQVTFTDKSIVWKSAKDELEVDWPEIKSFKEGERWLFLYQVKMLSHTIPFTAFENDEELQLFRTYLYHQSK